MIPATTDSTPISSMALDPLLTSFLGSMAIWPVALIALVPIALVLVPRDERVAGLRALAERVRAARGRGDPGTGARSSPDNLSPSEVPGTQDNERRSLGVDSAAERRRLDPAVSDTTATVRRHP